MRTKIFLMVFTILTTFSAMADSIPSGFSRTLQWRVGLETVPAAVIKTNMFVNGDNSYDRKINNSFAGDIRADFSFAPATLEGMLYKGVYQGVGLGFTSYSGGRRLLGNPGSAYVYQGAPIVNFSDRLWFGYEWQFGAAFGWKHDNTAMPDNQYPVSTGVTALMGLGFKLHYKITDRWILSAGLQMRHFSNGNTSWPNRGVNSAGLSLGIAYTLKHECDDKSDAPYYKIEDKQSDWFCDVLAYGAWRKRTMTINDNPLICPGRFGIVGIQVAPMRRLNRYVATGVALTAQWDESAGLKDYWIGGSYGEDVKFYRPPFGHQISVGLSAHAELTMPVFSVNGGIGYEIVNPKGEKRFFQSLTLKTFVTKHVFINTGYRLGSFKDPQNLMLGIGFRLR